MPWGSYTLQIRAGISFLRSVISQMWSSKTEHSLYFSESEIQFRILRTDCPGHSREGESHRRKKALS